MKRYYIITSRGVPVDVTSFADNAQVKLREWSSKNSPAEIVECVPLQTEFAFMEPEHKDDGTDAGLPYGVCV